MATSNPAEEHLRVIRSLMEKATIYRAISAPTALVGGCAGILAAAIFLFQSRNLWHDWDGLSHLFLACWLGALAIAAAGNVYFLRADAARRGERFVSAGMRAALRALWPSYLVAGVLTMLCRNFPGFLPVPWMLLYGLGLLGTQHFAPRSIVFLGWAFLIAGLLALIGFQWLAPSLGDEVLFSLPNLADGLSQVGNRFHRVVLFSLPNLAMGLTFGGFHLIYAICAWPRKSPAAAVGNAL